MFARLAARLSYVQGDFTDPKTFGRLATKLRAPGTASSTSRCRRRCSRPSRRGLHGAKLLEGARVSSRSRSATTWRRRARSMPICGSTSTSARSAASITSSASSACRRSSTCASRTRCSSRSGTATTSRACRSRWPRVRRRGAGPLLRPGRRPARRRRQPPAAAARGGRDGAPAGGDAATSRTRSSRSSARWPTPTSGTTCAGSTTATREIAGVAKDSTTETFAALRLEIDNWRWAGVPFFIRTGKRLAATETELRLVFKQPPRLGFVQDGAPAARAEPADRPARSATRACASCSMRSARMAPRRSSST